MLVTKDRIMTVPRRGVGWAICGPFGCRPQEAEDRGAAIMQTVTNRALTTSWLDQLKRRAEAQAAKARDAPKFLSDRVKAWLDGLPEHVVRKGLLLVDAADALELSERRTKRMLRLHGWWQSFGDGYDAVRWLPGWAPLHPQEQEWWQDDGVIYANGDFGWRDLLPAPPGWVAKRMWQQPDGSWVWW